MKLLLGGSPCTHWSIAQTRNRETPVPLSMVPTRMGAATQVLRSIDGMSCGHLALNKLGATVLRYYATEIDKLLPLYCDLAVPDFIDGRGFHICRGCIKPGFRPGPAAVI